MMIPSCCTLKNGRKATGRWRAAINRAEKSVRDEWHFQALKSRLKRTPDAGPFAEACPRVAWSRFFLWTPGLPALS